MGESGEIWRKREKEGERERRKREEKESKRLSEANVE